MKVRLAEMKDLDSILNIYNQGIEDRIATLEMETKKMDYINNWFKERKEKYVVIVAEENEQIVGWASINVYNSRCAYKGVGEIAIYIERANRGKGIGKVLLRELEFRAKQYDFHKLLLFTFPFNKLGQGLYSKMGYREVGTFKNQGILDGKFVDVMAMEKLLVSDPAGIE
ncbi:arsinothricin resistance N-acetyltransferase ArsN1 family A [Chengkuizengella axinellae]|uniref:Arsinothricin resistance N-acetyltransferase ArsN1 n=1 Tax=Chengkuizengella axinellae TaxID=3064388 RepID=A0ABT9J4M6_9BACL|nr:arsinothricin resistance N-acetyltransferase ArsN1 family A [Chengkuizengella sp. 2205SS18-9]MDP5276545.1 arsinothricin resistance N-acetyltransferase ArsN1 [Chengkuizengella sp. 2205SS18-9]